MGSKVTMPPAPPAPKEVDPGEASLRYLTAISDPELQSRLLQSEQTYLPQYTDLELSQVNRFAFGGDGQAGLLDIQDEATRRQQSLASSMLSSQRGTDVGDVERLGGRATAAFRAADPLQEALINQINRYATERFDQSGRLTPEQMRGATQAARAAGAARGRVGDQSTIAAEILNREGALQARRQEALQAAQMAFGMNQATAADPFQAILGRPGQSPSAGMASTQFAAGLAQQPIGPNLFDPNAGINLAMQNQANQANYQSSIYGAQAGYAGATNQGRGSMLGGLLGGLGALGGGLLGR